jgi:hypothetical protein
MSYDWVMEAYADANFHAQEVSHLVAKLIPKILQVAFLSVKGFWYLERRTSATSWCSH